MELRQLEYFIQICKSGSLTKAKEELGVTIRRGAALLPVSLVEGLKGDELDEPLAAGGRNWIKVKNMSGVEV
ncbi:hypothetical protein J2T17_001911 [Paenibacillus mucilaginosus]|uniref:hypothetical protein n=1 Tax=Paenibacillus mucilaginosus TaxID=61624 RepID=UPI003D1E7F64